VPLKFWRVGAHLSPSNDPITGLNHMVLKGIPQPFSHQGGRERGSEGTRDGGRERGSEGTRDGGRERGSEGTRDGGREGERGREGGIEGARE
jgi:hypothetical protein